MGFRAATVDPDPGAVTSDGLLKLRPAGASLNGGGACGSRDPASALLTSIYACIATGI